MENKTDSDLEQTLSIYKQKNFWIKALKVFFFLFPRLNKIKINQKYIVALQKDCGLTLHAVV